MFRVGEETGTLDVQLETAAAYYHRELEVRVKHFTSLFEPAVIIFMGVVVGFVAVALISAMYGIYSQVKDVRHRHRVARVLPTPWRGHSNCPGNRTEGGFTLIELVIVCAVLPLVIGAISVALISVFSLQSSVSGRLSDSGDAQVVSTNFEKDVQGASEISTDRRPFEPVALRFERLGQ